MSHLCNLFLWVSSSALHQDSSIHSSSIHLHQNQHESTSLLNETFQPRLLSIARIPSCHADFFCWTNFGIFFRAAFVLLTIWVSGIASPSEVAPILGKIVERHRDSVPNSVVPCHVEYAFERMELWTQCVGCERYFESGVCDRAANP